MSPEIAARLESLNIQWLFSESGYAVFARGDLVAVANFAGSGVAFLGSTGIMTDNGLSYLTWRDGRPVLSAHGGKEIPASEEQAEGIRHFSAELKRALGLGE